MIIYKTGSNPDGHSFISKTYDNGQTWFIPQDEANTDYQAYLKWLAEGNTPLPAENA